MQKPFDLEAFARSLDLSGGHLRTKYVAFERKPDIVLILIEADVDDEYVAVHGAFEPVPVMVLWQPDTQMLRFSIRIGLPESDPEHEIPATLVAAANTLNMEGRDRVSKVAIGVDEETNGCFALVSSTFLFPHDRLDAGENGLLLRGLAAEQMVRVFCEAMMAGNELITAVQNAGYSIPEEPKVKVLN